ncbi:Fasciclin-like arabinogalactan protein [Actinidia chinensis var. chinensis]|uniref:Fasciclin-like arabinogalactan protein n=1 Tax=Actinidia chinensis var. chinensis TaxID=1590841 RepID=A0A2R6QPF0_ACTCC|nr:Fasciclin-like arabinogalactan protein [Actinidia chinensis var. chinensis]
MSPKSCPIVGFCCLLLLFVSGANAVNITRILDRFPEYSKFNSLLNETGLTKEIAGRQTITVLAVDDDSMDSLSDRPVEVVKRILSVHIILDYFDIPKIQRSKKSTIATTLYQASGTAISQQGFVNITDFGGHDIRFGSAVRGSPMDVKLVGLVMSQPYNVSILHVDGIIVAPGIDGNFLPPPAGAGAPQKTVVPQKGAPSQDDESGDYETPAEAPAEVAETPADAPAPDAPANSPSVRAADDDDDNKKASPPSSSKSSSGSMRASFLVAAMALVSSLVAL